MQNTIKSSILLVQLCDTAFPIGAFAFSNGVESAVEHGIIKSKDDLKHYARAVVLQNLYSDFLASIVALKAAYCNDYTTIVEADMVSFTGKIANESRIMSTRMGKKCSEMCTQIFPDNKLSIRWLNDINSGNCHGSYNISLAILFRAAGLDLSSLFTALEYGTINMILNAALRIFRVSHIETQKILQELCALAQKDYEEIKNMELNDFQSFAPLLDIIASLHEQGTKRMFGN